LKEGVSILWLWGCLAKLFLALLPWQVQSVLGRTLPASWEGFLCAKIDISLN
jgi:hypothetical protein